MVGPRAAIPQTVVEAGEVNWLVPPPDGEFVAQAKFRAREVPQPVRARWDTARGFLAVTPDLPVIAAPGQALVLYDGERVLGGGFIRRAAVDRNGAAA